MSQKKLKKRRIDQGITQSNKGVQEKLQNIGVRLMFHDNWKELVILVVGVFLVFFNGLKGDFVSDDYAAIAQNPNVGDIIGTIKFGIRSGPSLVNAVVAALFGVSSSFPFHLVSVLLFLLIVILGYLLVVLILGKKVAFFASVLFVVLPVHVEAVSWISGKPYLLNALAVIMGLLLFALYNATLKTKYIKFFFCCLPFLIYGEPVRFLAFPIVLPFFVYSFCKNIDFKTFLKWFGISILGLVVIGSVFMKDAVIQRITMVNSGYNSSESIFYDPFFQYPTSITKYLQLIIVPTDLTLYHTMYIFPAWLNWVVLLLYISCVIYFFFKDKKIFFPLAFIFLVSAPSMAPVKVSWLVAERYVFLGSFGFTLFLGMLLERLYSKWQLVTVSLLAIFVSVYGWRTYQRNIDWQTNHNLWVNTCQVSPNSHNAWNNIGDDYDKLKEYENAIKGFTQSTVVKQNYADAYHNRGNIFFKIGRLDLARDSYMTALHYSPELFHSYLSLVQIDLVEKNANQAVADAQSVIRIQPNSPQSWYVYGVVMAQINQISQAKESFAKALQLDPNYSLAKEALTKL